MADVVKKATRDAYGEALAEIGGDERIVVLDADLGGTTKASTFGKKYPERYRNAGIAEANMLGMAAGLAACGKVPFVSSFAMFTAGRGYDQIRQSIAYPHLNVKITGSHAGLTTGFDGATHQCIEDLALMRVIPGMTVLAPCDANETREAVKAMLAYDGPVFMRTGRSPVENVTDKAPGYKFQLGKAATLKAGKDVTIIACGVMVQLALQAADTLKAQGIDARVLDMHTIKPLDEDAVLKAASETGAIVTAEEHNVIGGLGGAVAEVVGCHKPVPVLRVGVEDKFGKSGEGWAVMRLYGLTAEHIAQAAKDAIAKKA
jgi:transketolase